jgi:nucleoside triphosphate pyrophosphatase
MIDSGANLIEGSIKKDLVLASETGSLRRLLAASGLAFRVVSPNLKENSPTQALLETLGEADPADVAELLTRTRIEEANARAPGSLIIGAHQVVSLDGKVLEKPTTVDAARDLLFALRGKTHQLHSAVALAEDGNITWTHVETAQLTMRSFSAQFVGRYLAATGPQVCEWPGAYELDGVGLQLFDRIQGDFLTTLGAPIFLLFERLREIGLMAA